jgi:hypothetical protein
VPILRRFGPVGDKVHTDGKNPKNYGTSGWLLRISGLESQLDCWFDAENTCSLPGPLAAMNRNRVCLEDEYAVDVRDVRR